MDIREELERVVESSKTAAKRSRDHADSCETEAKQHRNWAAEHDERAAAYAQLLALLPEPEPF